MNDLIVIAHFIVLMNGVPVQIESVTFGGSDCPRPSRDSPLIFEKKARGTSCEGMAFESGTLRYWTLTSHRQPGEKAGWRGWQTRVAASEFSRLQAGSRAQIGFPQSSIVFESR